MTKTWIKTNYVPEGCDYITKGKWYEFEEDVSDDNDAQGGTIYTEVGKLYVRLSGCAHLKRHPWTVYMGDTPPCEPQPNKTIKTEEKQDMNIDWSKAPEGATHYNTANKKWYKHDEGFMSYYSDHREAWVAGAVREEYAEDSVYSSSGTVLFVPRPSEKPEQPSVKELPQPEFEVGDRVRVIKESTHGFKVGDTVKLSKLATNRGAAAFLAKDFVTGGSWFSSWFLALDEIEAISETVKPSEWKIRHIKSDDYKPKRDVAITILYKEIGNGYYEYKFAICSPKDNFNRKVGIAEALKKESDKVYNEGTLDIINLIVMHMTFSNKFSKDTRTFLLRELFS